MIVTSMQPKISSRRDIAVLRKESSSLEGEEDVKGRYDTGSDYTQDGIERLGRPQFGAHHRRRLARPARQFPGYSRPATDPRSGSRDPVQLAAARRRGRSMP